MRVLALDVGTSSVRALCHDETGQPLGAGTQAGYTTQDAGEIVELVRGVLARERADGEITALATACFGHSLLALDVHGRPLTPLLGWRDTRSADAADWLARRIDGDAVHARTGCHLHPSYWPAKLAWLAETEPRVFETARRFVSFPDYLYGELLGLETPTTLSIASGTGLLDLHTQTWDRELLELLGLEPDRLPAIGDDPLGAVEPWFPALLDGACSNVGAGCLGRHRAALMVGTSGALRIAYPTDQPQPKTGLFLYRIDGDHVLEGGALSDGGNLYRWLGSLLGESDEPLASRPPDGHGLTFLTLLGGERSPGWNPHARGVVAGLSFDTSALDLRQAALEGVAYRFAEVAELLPDLEELVATGGALVDDSDWVQIMADVLMRPITVSAVREASARGAAVLALERLGATPDDPPLGACYEPREERAEVYRRALERQRDLYAAVIARER